MSCIMYYCALYKWPPRMAALERGVKTQRAAALLFIASLFHESAEQKARWLDAFTKLFYYAKLENYVITV